MHITREKQKAEILTWMRTSYWKITVYITASNTEERHNKDGNDKGYEKDQRGRFIFLFKASVYHISVLLLHHLWSSKFINLSEKLWKKHSHLRSVVLQPNFLEELMQYIGTELDEENRRIILEEIKCPLCNTAFKTRYIFTKWTWPLPPAN